MLSACRQIKDMEVKMKLLFCVSITVFFGFGLLFSADNSYAQKPAETRPAAAEKTPAATEHVGLKGTVTIEADKTSLDNGGTITVSGTGPAGRPVCLEVWSERKVRASRFDAEIDKDTGKRPYVLYMTQDMPSYYKIFLPKDQKDNLEKIKKEKSKWSFSKALKDLGAEAVYSVPARIQIDKYQATLMGSIIGSRGELLPAMDAKENKKRSMQLVKARFRSPDKVLSADIEVKPDGS